MAVFHDIPEIITGDLPTPIKYYSPTISSAYKQVEADAVDSLLQGIPEDLRDGYRQLFDDNTDNELRKIVKAADKISALIKCIEERNSGNTDFLDAEKSTVNSLKAMNMPEVDTFIAEFLPAYSLTLDEQT